MFAQTRDEVRSHFLEVWQIMAAEGPLQPLQQLLAGVIEFHPHYHRLLGQPTRALNAEYGADSAAGNPFLHMSLHVAVREQLHSDRPPGVVKAYNAVSENRKFDAHALEHRMMDCLSASLWQAQRNSSPPDEIAYIACLNRIA